MRKLYLLSFISLACACGNGNNENETAKDSMSARDSMKKSMAEDLPPPTDLAQFNWIYSAFVHAATTGDDSLFDKFIHPQHRLWIVYSNGAMPSFIRVKKIGEFKKPNGKRILPIEKDQMICELKEEALPAVDCDKPGFYEKQGCFTTLENKFREEKIWSYAGLTNENDKLVAESAATISRAVVNTANYKYYFSLINGSWYLTFIDIRQPCSA
jgi:hypothetical protein